MSTRRKHPHGNPRTRHTPRGTILEGPYDRDFVLAELRAERARAQGPGHTSYIALADALTKSILEDLPGIPPETVGEILLCAACKLGGLAYQGLATPHVINVLAYAADNLVGGGTEPDPGDFGHPGEKEPRRPEIPHPDHPDRRNDHG